MRTGDFFDSTGVLFSCVFCDFFFSIKKKEYMVLGICGTASLARVLNIWRPAQQNRRSTPNLSHSIFIWKTYNLYPHVRGRPCLLSLFRRSFFVCPGLKVPHISGVPSVTLETPVHRKVPEIIPLCFFFSIKKKSTWFWVYVGPHH